MAYTANQYNYATPLSSVTGLVVENSSIADGKYFILHDNTLDGSYVPVSGDVGLWGSVVGDADGLLAEPFIVTVEEVREINAVRIVGSANCFPVDFTISFYYDADVIHTETVVGNTLTERIVSLKSLVFCSSYSVSVTRVSGPGVVRLLNVYTPPYVVRSDTAPLVAVEDAYADYATRIYPVDGAVVMLGEARPTAVVTIKRRDTLVVSVIAQSNPINIHTVMKSPSRRIYGRVFITYTDPMLDAETSVAVSDEAYNSVRGQLIDSAVDPDGLFFALYDNDLSGKYKVAGSNSQVGWTSKALSDENGYFAEPPVIELGFSARPMLTLTVYFNDSHGCLVEDFTIEYTQKDGTLFSKTVTGNMEQSVPITDENLTDVTSIKMTISKVSKPFFPASVIEIPVLSTIMYTGYQDQSNLMSIDVMEELTYDDEVEALGGVSANETTVVLDNSKDEFYFNNTRSVVASQLLRNRKIVPWLGAEITPGIIEWYRMGTYWSYSWKVPVNSLTATVVGFDTIGLLDLTSFTNHQTLQNVSLGYLVEYVLSDAKRTLAFLEWKIDPALYDVVIPYAWFAAASHTAALRRISQSYPMHIYCDREGRICAAVQRLHIDDYFDIWSDNDNVISKEYSSLFTTLPNLVTVSVHNPLLVTGEELVKDDLSFDVQIVPSRTLNFNKPYLSDIRVDIDCDETVLFTYEVYSWGIVVNFTGQGNVRSIHCIGTVVDTSSTSILTRRDEDSIRLNGAVTRDIAADFIQTSELGATIMNRFFEFQTNDKFDVNVQYRGDISLSISDPIYLRDGIAPDNRYVIRRHELSWNGALTGKADLNT